MPKRKLKKIRTMRQFVASIPTDEVRDMAIFSPDKSVRLIAVKEFKKRKRSQEFIKRNKSFELSFEPVGVYGIKPRSTKGRRLAMFADNKPAIEFDKKLLSSVGFGKFKVTRIKRDPFLKRVKKRLKFKVTRGV